MHTNIQNRDSALLPRKMKRSRNHSVSLVREATVWSGLGGSWRQLYGGFYDLGVSIEWHEFELGAPMEWARSFHPGSLELCLNLAGHAEMKANGTTAHFEPSTAGFYAPRRGTLRAWRSAGQWHRFLTIEFSPRFLGEQLGSCDGALHPVVEGFVRGQTCSAGLGEIHRLTAAQEQLSTYLVNPPVLQGARQLWYRGKILELMSEFFFERQGEGELFCDRQKRLARERVERVLALLTQHLAEPLSLEEIGRKAGCSPFHLSRTFSREMGMGIPQYLRKLRMERAAELLRSGKYNVTEAALEVGYSSLSHFSQAFCQTMGCCPGLYPLKTPTQMAAQTEGARPKALAD